MNELALFAGAGGGILASQILGANTVCAVEWDAYAAGVLAQRQNDGLLPAFPIWDDVSTFDGEPWRGIVDVVSGGFPCQDISAAGSGAGIEGSRSGLWKQMLRIIGEVRPGFVFMENSPLIVRRGLAVVISDLAEIGYDMQWMCLSAAECGAHHGRDRFWGLAYPDSSRQLQSQGCEQDERGWLGDSGENVADTNEVGRIWRPWKFGSAGRIESQDFGQGSKLNPWPIEPDVGRVANGVANRMDRLKCLGNGQVPRVAAAAFEILMGRITNAPAA